MSPKKSLKRFWRKNVKFTPTALILLAELVIWAAFQWFTTNPPPILDQLLVGTFGVWFASVSIESRRLQDYRVRSERSEDERDIAEIRRNERSDENAAAERKRAVAEDARIVAEGDRSDTTGRDYAEGLREDAEEEREISEDERERAEKNRKHHGHKESE